MNNRPFRSRVVFMLVLIIFPMSVRAEFVVTDSRDRVASKTTATQQPGTITPEPAPYPSEKHADVTRNVTKAVGQLSSQSLPSSVRKEVFVSTVDDNAEQSWQILRNDRTLENALRRWGSIAGWQIVWELEKEVEVTAEGQFSGTWEEAIGAVADVMNDSNIPITPIFYKGNKVLRIVHKGNR